MPSDWRPPSEIGDVGYAAYLVSEGIPEDDVIVQALRRRARPPQLERTEAVLKRELRLKGWTEDRGPHGRRKVNGWRHADGDTAMSLTDAVVKQLMREVRS